MHTLFKTDVREDPMQRFYKGVVNLIPDDPDVKEVDGRLYIEREIPFDMHLFMASQSIEQHMEEMIAYTWMGMYENFTRALAKVMMGKDYYYVLKLIPSVHENYRYGNGDYSIRLRITAEMSVVPERNVEINTYIPQWIYHNDVMTEWRCGYCTAPNKIEVRLCTQCGAPRALLVQEMMCVSCGTPKNNGNHCDRCGVDYS